jgi:DNA-binding transcriptional MocR family regulator
VLDPEAAPPLAALLPGWTDGEGPLYRRLAAAVAAAVDDGRLPGGALLPPERHVAAQLAVSRSTVVAAFDLLKAEGHLEARQGSGTWVPARPSTADRSNLALVEALDEHAIVRDLSGAPTGLLELTAAAIDCAPEVLAASTSIDPALLARMKAVTDFGTPILPQVVATALLADVDRVAARRRAELTERLDVLTAALARHLPDWRADAPAGGLSLWAKLPEPRAEDLARHATAHGVAVVPGPTFAVGDTRHADRIRLPFVAAPAVIEEGVRRLAAAWESLAAPGAQRRTAALVV